MGHDRATNDNSCGGTTQLACSQIDPWVLGPPMLVFISVFLVTNDSGRLCSYSFVVHVSSLAKDLLPSTAFSSSFFRIELFALGLLSRV